MTRFEDNLWGELEGKYGPELSEAAGPLHPRSRLRVPVIAASSLGAVGGSAAAVIVLTAASSSPAFAVTPHRDGTVSVVIRRIEGIPGANQRLAQLGIHARAVRVADGCQVPAARALARITVMTLARDDHKNWVNAAPGAIHARIRPAQIPIGRTLVIPAIRTGTLVRLARARAVRGVVPACLPPAVGIFQTTHTSSGIRVVTCRGAKPPRARLVVPGPVTNTTSTNAAPSQTTATQTTAAPATTTDSGTGTDAATATDSETATASGSTTGSGTTPSPTPVGPANGMLPPALLRACRLAAGVATR